MSKRHINKRASDPEIYGGIDYAKIREIIREETIYLSLIHI